MKKASARPLLIASTAVYILASAALWGISAADSCGFILTFTYFAFLPLLNFLYPAVVCSQNTPHWWMSALVALANQAAFPLAFGYLFGNVAFFRTTAGFVPLLLPLLGALAGWLDRSLKQSKGNAT